MPEPLKTLAFSVICPRSVSLTVGGQQEVGVYQLVCESTKYFRQKGGEIVRVTDEEIIAALFANATNRAAAEAVGLTERQFYNRTRAPTLRAKLDRAKRELLEHATSAAESRLSDAERK